MRANCWMGEQGRGPRRSRPEDPQRPRRDRQGHLDGDLRLRSAPLQRLHADHGEGRHPRPRVHGRGGRGRPGREEPGGRRPGGRAVPDRLRRLQPVPAGLYSLCENTNPNAGMAEKLWGHAPAGIFGYSHMTGGFAGGQAEYARVPFADVGPIKIESDLPDEKVLFLSDIFPTGYMGAEMCDIKPGDVVAVWGAGPVGQFAIAERLAARRRAGDRHRPVRVPAADGPGEGRRDDTINYEEVDVPGGAEGADRRARAGRLHRRRRAWRRTPTARRCTPTTGSSRRPAGDRPRARAAPGDPGLPQRGIVSVIGVYGGLIDKFPIGSLMNRSITLKTGQCHVQRYTEAAARADREGRDRPELRDHAPDAAGRGAGGLRDVPAQAGQLREGRALGLSRDGEEPLGLGC